jgi:hypothetical protein
MSQLPESLSAPAPVTSSEFDPEPAESSPAAVPEGSFPPPVLPAGGAPEPAVGSGPTPAPAADATPPDAAPPAQPTPAAGSSPVRLIAGIVAGAAVATLGGFILGEYPFTGVTPYVAGLLFALVVAEVILSLSRRQDRLTALVAAVCTVGGLGLAVWISTGEGIDPVPVGGWMTLIIGLITALLRGGIRTAARPGPSSPPSS